MATTPIYGTLQAKDDDGNLRDFFPRTKSEYVPSYLHPSDSTKTLYTDLAELYTGVSGIDPSLYLPLAGGEMTGNITRKNTAGTRTAYGFYMGNTGNNRVYFGWDNNNSSDYDGARLAMSSAADSSNPGCFWLSAASGANRILLEGAPDGTLKWNNKNILLQGDLDTYLPLVGGQMTGDITRKNNAGTRTAYALRMVNNNQFFIGWQHNPRDGARLNLYSAEHSTTPGRWHIVADDGTNATTLVGMPDGTLTWNSKNILLQGDLDTYLPLAGGTLTGTLTSKGIVSSQAAAMYRNVDNNSLVISGGSVSETGGHIVLRGPTHSSEAGWFYLKAKNSSATKVLLGKPDGTLTWDGNNVALSTHLADYLPLAGGTMTGEITSKGISSSQGAALYRSSDTAWLRVSGGNGDNVGASLLLYGGTSSPNAGYFYLRAKSSAGTKDLIGTPAGSLTWNGKTVATTDDLASYLPLTGGTVTGAITNTSSSESAFTHTHGTSSMTIKFGVGSGGSNRGIYQPTTVNDWLLFWNSSGTFNLHTVNGSSLGPKLVGTAAGSLKWNGSEVVTNGSNYLPLAGGTMTGAIKMNGYLCASSNTSYVGICGGTSTSNGAYCFFRGKDASSGTKGEFNIAAKDASNSSILVGKPDGTLTWGGNNVLTAASTIAAGKVSGTVSAATTGTKLNGQTNSSGSTSTTVSVAWKNASSNAAFTLPSGGTWVGFYQTYQGVTTFAKYSGGAATSSCARLFFVRVG